MIAKPSNKTLPITIALILLVALLGWLFGPDHQEQKTKKNKPVQVEPAEAK